jgi:hypothetical protein
MRRPALARAICLASALLASAADAESLADIVSRQMAEAAALAASCNRHGAAQSYLRAFGATDSRTAAEALDRGRILDVLGDHYGAMTWYRVTEQRQACGGPEASVARTAMMRLTGHPLPMLPIICYPRPMETRWVEASAVERRLLADMARCRREEECLVSRMRGEAAPDCGPSRSYSRHARDSAGGCRVSC